MSWYNPTSWFIDKQGVEAGAAADAKLDALNAKEYGVGGSNYNRIAEAEGRAAANRTLAEVMKEDATALSYSDATDDVNSAFVSGLGDAYDERTGQARSVLNAPFQVLFDSVPWYFWLIGLGALFLYLGGGQVVRKHIGKL